LQPSADGGRIVKRRIPRYLPVTPARAQAWAACADVVTRRLGDTLVVVCLSSNQIFELNPTGARIWELQMEARAEDDVIATLLEEFDVSAESAAQQVAALRQQLIAAGLIEARDAR
jgi:hypothetical protein